MLKFIVIGVALIFVGSIESKSIDPFIIGGRNASEGQFPYFASIRGDDMAHGCGGGIITRKWILTAAHCCIGIVHAVVVGSVDVNKGTIYKARRNIPHPLFPPTIELIGHNYSNWHDIGLIETVNEIVFTNLVQPIPLARRRVIGNVPAVMPGLGGDKIDQRNWFDIRFPTYLQYLRTNIITNTECAIRARILAPFEPRIDNQNIYSGHICTLNPPGVGACFADSGSPLVTRDGVVGVLVTGIFICGRGPSPDLNIRVSIYLSWIDSYVDFN